VEESVRALFAGAQVTCELRRAENGVRAESPAAWIDYMERVLGPMVMAKQALSADGRWDAARADLIALYESTNEATDGTLRARPEYLLTVARKPAQA
jgi:3-oxoacyl-ACP reductase-like protein